MEELRKKRTAARSAITRIYSFCNNPEADVQEVLARANKIDHYFAIFENIQNDIEADSMTSENSAKEEAVRSAVEEKYYQIKALQNRIMQTNGSDKTVSDNNQGSQQFNNVMDTLARNQSTLGMLIERLGTNQSSTPTPHFETAQQSVQLPRVKLPEFDGTITNWLHFRDLFTALIHNRSNISNIEKFEYLKGHIRGEALSLIKHLGSSNENYTIAWNLIQSKFNNSVELKRNYLKLLFDQPAKKGAFVADIKRLLNNTNEGMNALKAMKEPVDHWDSVLLFHLERKLDQESQSLWCRSTTTTQPSIKQFIEFLENRLRELEVCQANKGNTQFKLRGSNSIHTVSCQSCPICSQNHLLFNCEKFKLLNIQDRINTVKNNNICYNCLRHGHLANECKGSNCRQCNGRHNTLLHKVKSTTKTAGNSESIEASKVNINAAYSTTNKQITLLPTAVVMIQGSDNNYYPCRILLDTGAQTSLISESCVQRLNLKRGFDKTLICGIGTENKNYTRGKVQINIKSYTTNRIITTTALCLKKLTQLQPACQVSNDELQYFKNLCLADPQCNIPSNIDVLLGADVFSKCLLNQQIMHPTGSLSAWLTVFGWIILGSTTVSQNYNITIAHNTIDLSAQLQQFWDLEEVEVNKHQLTEEELAAESHYQQTVQRGKNGRYVVRLPLKSQTIEFGDTSIQAKKRFSNMEKKFSTNQQLYEGYQQFINEYLELDHMELAKDTDAKFYLPHHAVIKPTSTTTKLRVVFDGSAKGPEGTCLNEQLLVGPKIQNDIFTILLQFRKYKIGMCGDIEKMYRQIVMHPLDQVYQCILWRNDTEQRLSTYKLKTITYGTSAAPFLAIRTLKQIAIDNEEANPKIANIIMQCFYVDDFMSSIAEEDEAIEVREQLSETLAKSGLHLRKWSSNSVPLLQTINMKDREVAADTVIDDTQSVKTLGLYWNTTKDMFKYSIVLPEYQQNVTKREVLSIISKVFDPLGWVTPVTITLKVFMQKIWISGIEWDAPLTAELQKIWKNIFENLHPIVNIEISRWLQYSNESRVQLHVFADASECAYAAVIYLKVIKDNGSISTRIVTSKSRVAPLKQISVPRLELCACHLATKLVTNTLKAISIENIEVHGWTDSTIVLAWLADHPRKWKNFVANRTSQILQILPSQFWHHIGSKENPADLASRGITAELLTSSALWWNGPKVLQQNNYSKHVPVTQTDIKLEKRANTILHFETIKDTNLIDYFSDFTYLLRVTTRIYRFVDNCRKPITERQSGFLTVAELKHAHNVLIRKAQQLAFSNEINKLLKDKQLVANHKLAGLTPFIDKVGIMRVGGRLTNANIAYDQKHPIILTKKCALTKLIIRYYHLKYLHAGPRQLQYILGLKYWICSASYAIKQCVYKCTTCMRYRNKPFTQQMGNLPKHRFDTTSAFHNTGIDYAGPISIRSWKGRGSRQYKCWIALFVCLSTKAIHLELVTELTTDAFIAALRRFVSRRGKPEHIYSDNGTNFVGSNQKLKDLLQFMLKEKTQEGIAKKTAEFEIQWHFSPPSGPHFGGIWEAGVKSVKYYLHRVLGDAVVTYEEMITVLCQIESCLNSRPLTAKFENDPDPLTPVHFLIMKPMQSVADQDVTQVASNRLNRWQYLQQLQQNFWKKWSIDYLNQLQNRPKWKLKSENLEKGDIVLVKDEQCPPSKWPIGRILEVHPGQDGLVRVVTVQTQRGVYKRPICKLCPLIVDC